MESERKCMERSENVISERKCMESVKMKVYDVSGDKNKRPGNKQQSKDSLAN